MVITYDILAHNIELLEQVKKQYPILEMYECGEISGNTIAQLPWEFSDMQRFIEFKISSEKLIYDRKISYKDVINSITKDNSTSGAMIFKRKSKKTFDRIFTDEKYFDRYFVYGNRSYFPDILSDMSLMMAYCIQEKIDIQHDMRGSRQFNFYRNILKVPNNFTNDITQTVEMAKLLRDVVVDKRLDINRCNIKFLSSYISDLFENVSGIEKGSLLEAICDFDDVKTGQQFKCLDWKISYKGFSEVKIKVSGEEKWVFYSNFIEINQKRSEFILSILND